MYEGYIEHWRLKPVEHHFRYPLYFYCIDLDELHDLDRELPLFGYNRFQFTSLYDDDYLNLEREISGKSSFVFSKRNHSLTGYPLLCL